MAKFDTYTQAASSQAEDVEDIIYNISPVDNPVAAMSKTERATATLHEWNEDALQAAVSNALIEGADAGLDDSAAMTGLSNRTQIMGKVAEIAGTMEEVDKYGRDSEMAYQLELRYGELANDEELAIIGAPGGTRQTAAAGGTGTARTFACFQTQILDTTGGRTVGNIVITSAAAGASGISELETEMLDAHEECYSRGGNPGYIVTSPQVGRYIAQMAAASGRERDFGSGRSIVNVIDLYVSPYGELDVVLDRHAEDTMGVGTDESIMCGIDFQYSSTPVLRATRDYPIARLGDADRRQIIRESTYCLLNRDSGFMVQNISTGLLT